MKIESLNECICNKQNNVQFDRAKKLVDQMHSDLGLTDYRFLEYYDNFGTHYYLDRNSGGFVPRVLERNTGIYNLLKFTWAGPHEVGCFLKSDPRVEKVIQERWHLRPNGNPYDDSYLGCIHYIQVTWQRPGIEPEFMIDYTSAIPRDGWQPERLPGDFEDPDHRAIHRRLVLSYSDLFGDSKHKYIL